MYCGHVTPSCNIIRSAVHNHKYNWKRTYLNPLIIHHAWWSNCLRNTSLIWLHLHGPRTSWIGIPQIHANIQIGGRHGAYRIAWYWSLITIWDTIVLRICPWLKITTSLVWKKESGTDWWGFKNPYHQLASG